MSNQVASEHRAAIIRALNHAGVERNTLEIVTYHVEAAIDKGIAAGAATCQQRVGVLLKDLESGLKCLSSDGC